jgi:hypothetical protein
MHERILEMWGEDVVWGRGGQSGEKKKERERERGVSSWGRSLTLVGALKDLTNVHPRQLCVD